MNYENELIVNAQKMVAKGKGILAADESNPTCTKRFEALGVSSTPETRNEYRDLLLTCSNIEKYISGVIMFDETFRQSTTCKDHIPFAEYLTKRDILPGIKVDKGVKELAGFNDEVVTEGLDGLRDRLKEYYSLGARFAKWRAVIKIGNGNPSMGAITSNAHALARYAALCQESGLVPIVEPEVLMDGTHTIDECYEVTSKTLKTVFDQLRILNVNLKGMVLKPNMIISALDCPDQADVEKVAELTVKCLKENVPSEVPGIAFLSGGQSSDIATDHLNKMNSSNSDLPWNLTFSYGRALQQDALNTWKGHNREDAQVAFLNRAKDNSLATTGEY